MHHLRGPGPARIPHSLSILARCAPSGSSGPRRKSLQHESCKSQQPTGKFLLATVVSKLCSQPSLRDGSFCGPQSAGFPPPSVPEDIPVPQAKEFAAEQPPQKEGRGRGPENISYTSPARLLPSCLILHRVPSSSISGRALICVLTASGLRIFALCPEPYPSWGRLHPRMRKGGNHSFYRSFRYTSVHLFAP
jgi:hypothetical protein